MAVNEAAAARVHAPGGGQLAIEGEMTFATVQSLLAEGLRLIDAADPQIGLTVDLSAVTLADSAGVALLVEWVRQGRARGCELRFSQANEQLLGLARTSNMEFLFAAAA